MINHVNARPINYLDWTCPKLDNLAHKIKHNIALCTTLCLSKRGQNCAPVDQFLIILTLTFITLSFCVNNITQTKHKQHQVNFTKKSNLIPVWCKFSKDYKVCSFCPTAATDGLLRKGLFTGSNISKWASQVKAAATHRWQSWVSCLCTWHQWTAARWDDPDSAAPIPSSTYTLHTHSVAVKTSCNKTKTKARSFKTKARRKPALSRPRWRSRPVAKTKTISLQTKTNTKTAVSRTTRLQTCTVFEFDVSMLSQPQTITSAPDRVDR